MKRIAFVTHNYTGATLPIVKELLSLGYRVDYFFLFGKEPKNGEHPKEAMLLRNFHARMGLHEIDCYYFKELYDYMGSENFHMFYFRTSRPFENVPILRNVMQVWRNFQFNSLVKYFKSQNYDMINMVCNFDHNDFLLLHKKLPNVNIITSFHEVCNHWNPDFNHPSPLLKHLFSAKKEIVVHSKNSYRDILQYHDVDKECVHHINFGIFETFKTMEGCVNFELPSKYILFFGGIRPYKGLPYLLEALKIDPTCLGNYKLVIAGGGHDDALDEFRRMENVMVLNRYIKNEEVVYLIKHCSFVVCPYTTMSQSGLPQTVFAFDKPIIASDLDGFKEVVTHQKTGLLFKTKDATSLAEVMKRLSTDDDLYCTMVENIKIFGDLKKEYGWPYITQQYLEIIAKK